MLQVKALLLKCLARNEVQRGLRLVPEGQEQQWALLEASQELLKER